MKDIETFQLASLLNLKLPGLNHFESEVVIMSWFILLLLVVLSFFATRRLKELPSGLQNVFELLVEFIEGLIDDIFGKKGRKFFPLIATFAVYILASNLIGLIPGFKSPTANLNTTVSLALITFFTVHFFGIKEKGIASYLKHYLGPVGWLAPLMFPLHVIGELAKPLSLSFRLFGNIMGEDIVLLVLLSLVVLFIPTEILYMPLMGLAIFTSVIQSFIFVMLSMNYIAQVIEEEEH